MCFTCNTCMLQIKPRVNLLTRLVTVRLSKKGAHFSIFLPTGVQKPLPPQKEATYSTACRKLTTTTATSTANNNNDNDPIKCI